MFETHFSRMFGIFLIGVTCLVLNLPPSWSQEGATGNDSESTDSSSEATPEMPVDDPRGPSSRIGPGAAAAAADTPLDPMRSRFLRDQLRMLRSEERQILFEMNNLRPSDPGANVVRSRMEEDLAFVREEAQRIEQLLGMEPGSSTAEGAGPSASGRGEQNSPFAQMSPSSLERIQGELEFEIQQIDRTLGLLDEDEQDLAQTLKKERSQLLEELNQVMAQRNRSGEGAPESNVQDGIPGRRTPPRDVPPFPGFENVNPARERPRGANMPEEGLADIFGSEDDVQRLQREARIRELEDSIERFRNMGLDALVETAQKELEQIRNEQEADDSETDGRDIPPREDFMPPGFSRPGDGETPVDGMPRGGMERPEQPPAFGWSGDPWSAGEATSAEIGQLRNNIESLQGEVSQMRDQLSALQSQIQLLNQNLVLANQQKASGNAASGGPMENRADQENASEEQNGGQ